MYLPPGFMERDSQRRVSQIKKENALYVINKLGHWSVSSEYTYNLDSLKDSQRKVSPICKKRTHCHQQFGHYSVSSEYLPPVFMERDSQRRVS